MTTTTTAPSPAAPGVHSVHPVHPTGRPLEPDPLSNLLAGILSRTHALQSRAGSCGPGPASSSPASPAAAGITPSTRTQALTSNQTQTSTQTQTPDHTARLTANGWPPRAVHTLPRMTGPALVKAREILPLILHDGILILLGSTGRGKTVMAAWWAWQRLLAGRSCGRFLTAYQLFARMKQCWTRGEDADAALRGWRTTPFLAIDELQTRAGSDWENSVLDELINARYAARLPTVLLGNLEPGSEHEALGPRILDRARECGGVIHCGWGSYRG